MHLSEIAPRILQDMRYAGPDNFTGATVPGYRAAECLLLPAVAVALARAQTDAEGRGYSLKVYDCYRPERAVRAFAEWARQSGPGTDRSRGYHPRVERSELFDRGYISRRSGHSRAAAVDLTLVRLPVATDSRARSGSGADCTASVAERDFDTSIDMGTGFDCFDVKSHTAQPGLATDQRANRKLLVEIMQRQGFQNYFREWWHFTHVASAGAPPLDLDIVSRPNRSP